MTLAQFVGSRPNYSFQRSSACKVCAARRRQTSTLLRWLCTRWAPLRLSNCPIRSGLHTFEYVTHIRQQVFSGSFPFEGNRNEAVILLVKSGEHPRRPESGSDHGLTDELWKMMKGCWKQTRDRRWNISRIVSILKRHSASAVAGTE